MLVSHPVASTSTWYFLNGSNVDEFKNHTQKVIEVEGAVLGAQNFFGSFMVYDIVSVM